MAVLNLTKSTTVAQLKKEFNETFGAVLRIYSGRSQAEETTTLGELGLSNEGTFECRSSLTVVRFIERIQNEFGLKVKVYTCDDWVAALDGLTLESAGKVKKNAVKADMESMIAYQRTEEVDVAETERQKAEAEAEAVKAEKARLKAEADKKKAEEEAEKARLVAEKETQNDAKPAKSKSNAGELPGVFSVGANKKVRFSQGRLQFNPAKYEFRFAKNQYEVIPVENNKKVAPNYDGWIDLFGWGTSGYMGCQPTEISKNASEFGPKEGGLTGANANYDWGVYNPITNGGNKEGLWRTPTADEWEYLMNKRPNADKLKVQCTVCGVVGYFILPDDFWNNRLRLPLDITASYSVNKYTAEQWSQLEALGVVCVPESLCRCETGYYILSRIWTSSVEASLKINAIHGYHGGSSLTEKYDGLPVRLIKDIK